MSFGDLEDLMLAVAVESSPLNTIETVVGCCGIPVEGHRVTSMTDDELAAFMMTRKRDDKRSELSVRTRSIDMSLEETGRGTVDLVKGFSKGCSNLLRWTGGTYIQLVQLCLDTLGTKPRFGIRKKDLSDRIDDTELVWAEIARESGAIQLGRFAVRLVHDILALVAEACGLTVPDQLDEGTVLLLIGGVNWEDELRDACGRIWRVPAKCYRECRKSVGGVIGPSVGLCDMSVLCQKGDRR
jgi:hypothetical protein